MIERSSRPTQQELTWEPTFLLGLLDESRGERVDPLSHGIGELVRHRVVQRSHDGGVVIQVDSVVHPSWLHDSKDRVNFVSAQSM